MPRAPKDPPRIAGYEILEPIGSGGQGSVWRARQKSLDRVVAIKVLWAEDAADPMIARRFIEEARIASRLHHPNIIQVIDVGEGDGTYWFAMEYVAGVTALQLFRERGPLPEGEVLEIAWQVAQALQHGCDRGLIHGDLKPENILITPEGVAKVVDFGLARLTRRRGGRGSRDDDPVQGTEGFVAPEILANRSTGDARTDLFALGVTMYELLATTLPPGPRKGSALGPDVRERRPNVSRRTAELLMRLLAPDPSQRPESPGKLVEELARRSSLTLPATVAPVAPVKPAASNRIKRDRAAAEPSRNRRWLLWVVIGVVAAGIAAIVVATMGSDPPGTPPVAGGPNTETARTAPDAGARAPDRSAESRATHAPPSGPARDERPPDPAVRTFPAASAEAGSRPAAQEAEPASDGGDDPDAGDSRPAAGTGAGVEVPSPPLAEPPPGPASRAESRTAAPAVTSESPSVRVLPPAPGLANAPWTIMAQAGEVCDVSIRTPVELAGAEAAAEVLPEGQARGLAIRPGDEPGTHVAAFRCPRSAPFGPRDFTVLFRAGDASAKVRLRIQVTRPTTLLAMAPSPVLKAALGWLERHQAPSGAIEAAGFPSRCTGDLRCGGRGVGGGDVGVTALAALAALRAGDSGDWVRSLLGSLVAAQRSDGRFTPPDDAPGAYGHMIATEACALGWHLLGDSRVREAAQRGLDAIGAARNVDTAGGAWRFGVKDGDNDTSVTTWALRALLAGRMAGLAIDDAALAGGLAWIRRVTETNPADPAFGRIGYDAPGMLPPRPGDRGLQFPPALSESTTAGALAVALQARDRKPSDRIAQTAVDLVLACRPHWDASTPEAARFVRDRLANPSADLTVISTRDFDHWVHGASLFRTWKLVKGRSIPDDKAWKLVKSLGPGQLGDGCAAGSFDPLDPFGPELGRAGSTAMLALALATEQYPQPLLDEVEP